MTENDNATAVGRTLYYARRAGFLEGALQVIAWGTSGVDPQVAAQRALDAVGDDVVVNTQDQRRRREDEP